MPDGQGGERCTIDFQGFLATLGQGISERHLIAFLVTEQKRTSTFRALLCSREDMVDRLDHRVAGAIVGVQRVPATIGGLPGAQVGVNVGATEGIDRLLGVADQEQAGLLVVIFQAIDAVEDPVLHRIGVLKLIDQRHRKLLANQRCQPLTTSAV